MERFQGFIGIVLILGLAWLASNNKKKINYRLVFSGIGLQVFIAILIFKVPPVQSFFNGLGKVMTKIEQFAFKSASFVYGGVVIEPKPGTGSFSNYAGG